MTSHANGNPNRDEETLQRDEPRSLPISASTNDSNTLAIDQRDQDHIQEDLGDGAVDLTSTTSPQSLLGGCGGGASTRGQPSSRIFDEEVTAASEQRSSLLIPLHERSPSAPTTRVSPTIRDLIEVSTSQAVAEVLPLEIEIQSRVQWHRTTRPISDPGRYRDELFEALSMTQSMRLDPRNASDPSQCPLPEETSPQQSIVSDLTGTSSASTEEDVGSSTTQVAETGLASSILQEILEARIDWIEAASRVDREVLLSRFRQNRQQVDDNADDDLEEDESTQLSFASMHDSIKMMRKRFPR